MINYHGAVLIESLDKEYKGSLFAQLGYMSRGSDLGFRSLSGGFNNSAIVFRNISLALGAKKKLLTKTLSTPYYFVGVRAEYQLSNNLEAIQIRYSSTALATNFPLPGFVRNWTYGLSLGAGIEFLGSEYVAPALELTISPDIGLQYESPALPVVNPSTGQGTTLPERKIRNITLELSLVVRFFRKVIYTD